MAFWASPQHVLPLRCKLSHITTKDIVAKEHKKWGITQKALAVDLIDVRRLERILVSFLRRMEEEAMPVMAVPVPPGRFARPGNVFAQASDNEDNPSAEG